MTTSIDANGKNMSYSKFVSRDDDKKGMISSKTGMFIFYFLVALFASIFLAYKTGLVPLATILESLDASSAASFLDHAVAVSDSQLLLVAAVLSIHFTK